MSIITKQLNQEQVTSRDSEVSTHTLTEPYMYIPGIEMGLPVAETLGGHGRDCHSDCWQKLSLDGEGEVLQVWESEEDGE